MKCPHCGDTIHDPGLDHFCPSCGKDVPHQSPDERTVIRDQRLSIGLLTISLIMIMMGASFILPDVIIHAIDPELHLMYWPYSLVVLVIGVVLLFVRHPFAKRNRKFGAVLLEKTQAGMTCSYCGAENLPGSGNCHSCGAPLRR